MVVVHLVDVEASKHVEHVLPNTFYRLVYHQKILTQFF